ncbi:hypothetical protein [Wolbachia pipientis]|uniref:hypothetical protein n=1 Tax=Wolbachia pipientis TaxID=955 RepID=UPI0025A402E7|nr:hypothetical protein [Wolbachia pipientis]MDM8335806.1 hypothetical protein [Wolbachia pipientis]
MYNDLESYEIADKDMIYQNIMCFGGVFGEIVGLAKGTVKKLAKNTTDNFVIPVCSYVAKKVVMSVGEHVTKIVLPVGKYV